MSRKRIEATATSRAPREAVWDVLVDVPRWSDWGPWTSTKYRIEGDPAPGGVGAMRSLKMPGTTLREEITDFDPPLRMTYALRSGLPVRDYRAEIVLSDTADGGTLITWGAAFDGRLGLGAAMRVMLGRAIPDVARRAAREAERRTG